MLITKKGIQMTKDTYIIKELEARIKAREAYRDKSIKTDYKEAIEYDTGYIKGLRYAVNMIKYCKPPHNDEEWEEDDGKGPIRYKTFKEMVDE
tara:strand:- start:123 stop:401 length:279 start_codon:yes stop_codon:yes gene_type:complete